MTYTKYKPFVIDTGYLFPLSLADFLGAEDEVHIFSHSYGLTAQDSVKCNAPWTASNTMPLLVYCDITTSSLLLSCGVLILEPPATVANVLSLPYHGKAKR